MSGGFLPSGEFALECGQRLLAEGRTAEGLWWLRRSARLMPTDTTVALALASGLNPIQPARAIQVLDRAAERDPSSAEIHLALAAMHHAHGDPAAAAAALHRLLVALPPAATPGFIRLAEGIIRLAGSPGWISLDGNGTLLIGGAGQGPLGLSLSIDGEPVRSFAPRRAAAGWIWDMPATERTGRVLTATAAGSPLLGSGLSLPGRFCSTGFVDASPIGQLDIWSWRPADPGAEPRLRLQRDGEDAIPLADPVRQALADSARPGIRQGWHYVVPAAALDGVSRVRILAEDGTDLWGSPLSPFLEHTGAAAGLWRPVPVGVWGTRPAVPCPGAGRPKACDIIMPVRDQRLLVHACLLALVATRPAWSRIIVVDDGSSDPDLATLLEGLRAEGAILLVRHPRPLGYPAAINAGLRLSVADGPRDVLLLNSDTLMAPGWLDRLRGAAYATPGIGSVTPLTCDGTIVSCADPAALRDLTTPDSVAAVDRACARSHPGQTVDLPTCVGFCVYITHACLQQTGPFREDLFAQGYGEENDWSMRAHALGWRHVAALDVFVAHLGGRTFGEARQFLTRRNAAVLSRLHPGYDEYVQGFIRSAPLWPAWRTVAERLLREAAATAASVLLITHGHGGGVERHVRSRMAAFARAGMRALVLRPGPADGKPAFCRLHHPDQPFAELTYSMPGELPRLAEILLSCQVKVIEVHHMLGHDAAVGTLPGLLGIPATFYVHDYGYWCPRFHLVGRGDSYCGEPTDTAVCEGCVAELGCEVPGFDSVAAYRGRSRGMLGSARTVVVPAPDVARRMSAHFPAIHTTVRAWEDDGAIRAAPPAPPRQGSGPFGIVVVGAIGVEKGYDILLDCARDAERRKLPLLYQLAGFSIDDARLMETGKAMVSGRYEEEELADLLASFAGTVGFMPSLCPETWCFALSSLWRAGLPVACFDIGTQSERVRASGDGMVLPVGSTASTINNRLLDHAIAQRSRRQTSARPIRSRNPVLS